MAMQTELVENFEDNRYEMGKHFVGISLWEFEWCPKYRYKMFRKWKYKKLVEACIRKSAFEHGIKWIELNVQPEHIQGTASIPMTMTPSKALQFLKGRSAFLFFKNCPKDNPLGRGGCHINTPPNNKKISQLTLPYSTN